MNDEEIMNELTIANDYLSKFNHIPGTQVKMIFYHLIKVFDKITSFVIKEETSLERDYLTLSKYRLFNDEGIEQEFYDTYFYLKNLLDRTVLRVSNDIVRIIGYKRTINAGKDFFQELVSKVERISHEVIAHS